MCRFMLVCCLLLALRVCAQPELVPGASQPSVQPNGAPGLGAPQAFLDVMPVLNQVDPRQPETMDKARAVLLRGINGHLAEMREVGHRIHLFGQTSAGRGEWQQLLTAEAQEQVLDRAVMQLSHGIDLPEFLQGWAAQQVPEEQHAIYQRNPLSMPLHLIDVRLDRSFPDYAFYLARYSIYPNKPDIVRPLTVTNLFAVKHSPFIIDNRILVDRPMQLPQVTLITAPDELQAFFRANLPPPVRNVIEVLDNRRITTADPPANAPNVVLLWTDRLQNAAAAWLLLSSELHQDGYYRFQPPAIDIGLQLEDKTKRLATGKMAVLPTCGNSGVLSVRMQFGDDPFKLLSIEEEVQLQPGIRPRDQAQKLLDPDPAVRKQAGDDLRLMGPEAFGYLMRERTDAKPELQAAIDWIWQDIGKVMFRQKVIR